LTDVYDAIEMRGMLEGAAARLAAERLQDSRELAGLRSLQDELERVMPLDPQLHPTIDSFAHYLDLNESFHSTLVGLAKSPMLRRTLDRLLSLPFASPSATVFARLKLPKAKELLTVGHEHHNAIIEALQNRQGSRAEGLAREHAGLALRNLEAALADKDALNSVPGASLIRMPGVA
jgi:GntR family transcriptional regulator of vanillate catabolism